MTFPFIILRRNPFSAFCLLVALFFSSFATTPAIADDYDPIKVLGLVPKFQEHHRQHKWTERWYYDVQYPEFGIKAIDTPVAKYANGLLINIPKYAQSVEHPDAPPADEIKAELGIGCTVSAPSTRYMSVTFDVWDHGGGAHAQNYTNVLTFDRKTNKQIYLKDVFTNWGVSEKKLTALIGEVLIEGEYNIKGMKSFFDPTIQRPDSTAFQLTPDGITIYFNYWVPWLWGDNAMSISKDRLIEIGAKPQIWAKQ